MDFLGNVNVFHGRVERRPGAARSAGPRLSRASERHPAAAAGYARPHELDRRTTTKAADCGHNCTAVITTGSIVKLELHRSTAV